MNLEVTSEAPILMRRSTSRPKSRSEVHTGEHAKQFAWIDWIIARTGKTDTSLAEGAGLVKNYLYRKRADGTLIQAPQLRQIADAYRVPGPEAYQSTEVPGFTEEGIPFEHAQGSDDRVKSIVSNLLASRPNAACWILKTRALEAAGYLSGDIVITDSNEPSRSGDAVIAQVYDMRRGTAETVFRILTPPFLLTASFDAGLRKPLLIDDERVVVVGPITETFRRR